MKKTVFYTMILGVLGLPTPSYAVDLTTFGGSDPEQSRIARYTNILGFGGETSGLAGSYISQGIYDYTVFKGGSQPWVGMCDGDTRTHCSNTYDPNQLIQTHYPGTTEDFFGYQFKKPASITEINYSQLVYLDGGTFVETPRVEVLVGGSVADGGTWQTTEVTWDTPYNILWDDEDKGSISDGVADYRDYTITPVEETGQVWGVRLINSTRAENEHGITSGDTDGYVSCTEFQISGDSSITESIDLSTNLALNQFPIWTVAVGNPGSLTDGVIDISSNKDTYGGSPSSEEFVGVMFLGSPQSNVAAIGSCATLWADGGALTPETLDVQYTMDGGATWMSVTGLDLGRYADDLGELRDWTTAYSWYNLQSHLFTFDPITEEIDGIRMIGESYNNPSAGDPNGFIAMLEMEVFASHTVPEPSMLLLLLGGIAMCGLIRRKK